MSIDIVGILSVFCGVLLLFKRVEFAIYALIISCLLGAAAALKLPSLGDSSIMPSHLLLAFLLLHIAANPLHRDHALESLTPPNPGFLLLLIVGYGALSAVFMPRIFAGLTYTYSLARSGEQLGIVSTPLRPSASNITQTVYLVGDLACFASFAALAALGKAKSIGNALILAGGLNLLFGALDLATFATGTQEVLSIIRNANYRMLEDGQIAGFKRIVGSYAEAGAFGYSCLSFYAYCIRLWLLGYRTAVTGPLAWLLLATLLLTTSTTAYAAVAVFSVLQCFACIGRLAATRGSSRDVAFVLIIAVAPLLAFLGLMLVPAALEAVTNLFDAVAVNKLGTQSGVERMRWNEHALQTFAETAYFGAGLGSVRASSMAVAMLGNLGVLGTALFAAFFAAVLLQPGRGSPRTDDDKIRAAASSAVLALLTASAISAAGVDPGLPFFIFAALATSARTSPRAAPGVLPTGAAFDRGGPAPRPDPQTARSAHVRRA